MVPSQEPELRVTGGQEAKECGIPGVLSIETMANGMTSPSLCTATLIHPKVILYAGHCGTIHSMTPGERWQQEKMSKDAFAMSKPHPAGNTGAGSPNSAMDWAVAVLKEPLEGVPVIPIAYGCELEMLIGQGKAVTFAGYADNAVGKQSDKIKDYYLKWANTQIGSLTDTTIKTSAGSKKVTACRGDSGGPMLARTKDGSWRTIGIASSLGPSASTACGTAQGFNTYSRVRKELVEWIETETKIDVTPCFDLDGKPTPSVACDKFMAFADDPASPSAKWDNHCADAKQRPQKDACGIEDSGEKEPEPETTEGSESTESAGESGDPSSGSGEPTPDESPSPEPSPDKTDSQQSPSSQTPSGDTKKESPEEPKGKGNSSEKTAPEDDTGSTEGATGGADSGSEKDPAVSSGGGCRLDEDGERLPWALWSVALTAFWMRQRRRQA